MPDACQEDETVKALDKLCGRGCHSPSCLRLHISVIRMWTWTTLYKGQSLSQFHGVPYKRYRVCNMRMTAVATADVTCLISTEPHYSIERRIEKKVEEETSRDLLELTAYISGKVGE